MLNSTFDKNLFWIDELPCRLTRISCNKGVKKQPTQVRVLFQNNCTALWNWSRTQLFLPWSQFVNLILSSCLVHLWDYLGSTTYVVPCLVIYQERIVSTTTPIGFQKSSNHGGHGHWTEGPSSWSTNWTDLYYKHKHKRRPVISQIPSSFFCLPKCNFAQRSSDEHSSNLLFPLECTREYKR